MNKNKSNIYWGEREVLFKENTLKGLKCLEYWYILI